MNTDPSPAEPAANDAEDAPKVRLKPTKALPSDRVSFDKQLLILRAYSKASTNADRKAVSNADVARYADVSQSSISICNPFYVDVGLLVRDGMKQLPHDAVFEYDQAAEWASETATTKLARPLSTAWFSKALLPKLALRPLSKGDAIQFLAEECRAGTEYRQHLELVLDYMRAAGLVTVEGNTVTRGQRTEPAAAPATPAAGVTTQASSESKPLAKPVARAGMKRIEIALPDKDSVTIELPESFDKDDWILVSDQLAGYIKRWKQFKATNALKEATDEDEPPPASNGGTS